MLNDGQIVGRLTLSLVLGGLIGFEREVRRRSAGFRTHILVCVGSCLIMLTSLYVFDIYSDKVPLDPVRVAAQVVTGIGFLGAGAIIRDSGGVKGLTTAASLWVVAALGLAIGCGFYTAAVFTSVLSLVALLLFRNIEYKIVEKTKGGE